MISFVPENAPKAGTCASFSEWRNLLADVLECLEASIGWIGIVDIEDRLTFPIRIGLGAEQGLWRQSLGEIWGFAIGDKPAYLNAPHPWLTRCDPPLRNLLSCPLRHEGRIVGQVVAAEKPHAFTDRDAAILQGFAHPLARLLARHLAQARTPLELSPAWRRLFDRADEAVLLLDDGGVLRYVNAAWIAWTGFRAEELLGRTAPFPFWVRPQDLAQLQAPPESEQAVPFRHRDQTLFWCRMESVRQRWGEYCVTVAFLQRLADKPPTATLHSPAPTWLPLLIDRDGGIDGWGPRWQQLTGLSSQDVEGARGEMVLDWLFPQQRDRERVADCLHHPESSSCQVVLEIAAANGSQRVLCTFLPCPATEPPTAARRWLLLVGDAS